MFKGLTVALTLTFASIGSMPVTAAASSMAAMTCPAGQKSVDAYVKADGTKIAAYCRSSKSSKTCPAGQQAVDAYTKADGTKVAAYCRKTKM